MAWLFLIPAGLMEAGWAIDMKYPNRFTRPLPSVAMLISIGISLSVFSE